MNFNTMEDAVNYAIEQRQISSNNIIIHFNREKNHFFVSDSFQDGFKHHLFLTLIGEDVQFCTQTEENFFLAIIDDIQRRN